MWKVAIFAVQIAERGRLDHHESGRSKGEHAVFPCDVRDL